MKYTKKYAIFFIFIWLGIYSIILYLNEYYIITRTGLFIVTCAYLLAWNFLIDGSTYKYIKKNRPDIFERAYRPRPLRNSFKLLSYALIRNDCTESDTEKILFKRYVIVNFIISLLIFISPAYFDTVFDIVCDFIDKMLT